MTGKLSNAAPSCVVALIVCLAAMLSITARLAFVVILPNTVNPPLLLFRFDALFAVLKNHWLVALSGSPSSLAIASVPRVFETLNSFLIGLSWGILWAAPFTH